MRRLLAELNATLGEKPPTLRSTREPCGWCDTLARERPRSGTEVPDCPKHGRKAATRCRCTRDARGGIAEVAPSCREHGVDRPGQGFVITAPDLKMNDATGCHAHAMYEGTEVPELRGVRCTRYHENGQHHAEWGGKEAWWD